MASNVSRLPNGGKVVYDWSAFDQIRKSSGIRAQLQQIGEGIAARAGAEDFKCSVFDKSSRTIAVVTNSTSQGARKEATDKVLTKAVR